MACGKRSWELSSGEGRDRETRGTLQSQFWSPVSSTNNSWPHQPSHKAWSLGILYKYLLSEWTNQWYTDQDQIRTSNTKIFILHFHHQTFKSKARIPFAIPWAGLSIFYSLWLWTFWVLHGEYEFLFDYLPTPQLIYVLLSGQDFFSVNVNPRDRYLLVTSLKCQSPSFILGPGPGEDHEPHWSIGVQGLVSTGHIEVELSQDHLWWAC